MNTAIIVHGKPDSAEYYNPKLPSSSNWHWIPWLQKQLIIHEISAQTPEIPHAFQTDYSQWSKEFERFDINSETILVGHSCGAGFLIRWLSQHKNRFVGKVVLVAPWLDPDRELTTDFFEFVIDTELTKRTNGLWIFNSDNDYKSVHKSVSILRNKLHCSYREFHNMGHFNLPCMSKAEFPELLEVLL